MAKQQIRSSKLVDPGAHFSQAVAVQAKGVMVFISDMTARRPAASPPPASTVVEVSKRASPEFLVQISAIALVSPEVR